MNENSGRLNNVKTTTSFTLCPSKQALIVTPSCGTLSVTQITDMEVLPKETTLELRRKHIGEACRLWYPTRPLKIVRAEGQYMYDEQGNAFLDCINNVCHVGHSHPRVVQAATEQMAILNTNNRFLHDTLVRYAERLTQTMPEKLSVCFLVNSGSEANDLAIQLAQRHTGHKDVITLDHAYHGHLQTVLAISPYKHKLLGKDAKKKWVHVVPPPDMFRGKHCKAENPGEAFANDVKGAIDKAHTGGRKIAAFFAESLQSCGGQLVYPPGYFKNVYRHVRQAGGLCVADEVQVGFGRVGNHWWAFQTQGSDVVPDIVTMGKPMGNGHPIAAVVTTPEIAASMSRGGYQYFNTYGGNPVSCSVGMAVMDIIEDECLRENATLVGDFLRQELLEMKQRFKTVGDVRGIGLFIGIELVRDRTTQEPAPNEATYIVEFLRDKFILVSTEGPFGNVLKLKPPMCFSLEDARNLLARLTEALQELESFSDEDLEVVTNVKRQPVPRQAPGSLLLLPSVDTDEDDLILGPSKSNDSPTTASDDSGLDLSPGRQIKDANAPNADISRPAKRQKIDA